MCCGQKRSQIQTSQVERPAPRPAQRSPRYIPGNSEHQAVQTSLPVQTPQVSQPTRADLPRQGVQPPPSARVSTPSGSITIRYLETAPVRVKGLTTGQSYEFSGPQSVQTVDARDATSLLSTRFFSRA